MLKFAAALFGVAALACGDPVRLPPMPTVPLSGCLTVVVVSPSNVTLSVGDTIRLHASACESPSAPWFWKMSDTAVASIDSASGLLSARKPGSASAIAIWSANVNVKGAAAVQVIP